MRNKKLLTSAPLPFQGQKRRWIKQIKEILNRQFSDKFIYVDLFGGSGFVSHIIKHHYPDTRVIYNDFDDYHLRIANIDRTNRLLADLRVITKDLPDDCRITGVIRELIIKRLEKEQKTGFIDWITVSSWILFSMNYCTSYDEIIKQNFYNTIRKSDYCADGYLSGVEIVKKDYRALFDEFKDIKNVVFVVDPPYLSTDTKTYKEGEYWRLKDYLDVLKCLNNTNYIYFTSDKSSMVELMDWLEKNLKAENPFKNSIKMTVKTNCTKNVFFEDIMLSKRLKHH